MNASNASDGIARARRIATRALILSHRWLGIVLGLFVVVWFASGIAMMYVGGMPRLTPQQRLDHLPEIDLAAVRLTPAQALAQVPGSGDLFTGAPVLTTLQGRPAWRFADANVTVFADDSSRPGTLDEAGATDVARQFLRDPAPALHVVKRMESPDQWTLSLRSAMPLLKLAAGDTRGTQVYVSLPGGEVVQVTTRADRAKAWIATIPHWLYFSALRQNQPLWYRIVVWLSGLVCVSTLLGLGLAFTQWRRTRPFDIKRAIPYRGGMRWHYIAGALFGLFALTWAFSGLLSMEPFRWTSVPDLQVPADALSGGEPELSRYEAVDLALLPALVAPRLIKEIAPLRIHGEHYLLLRTSAAADAPDDAVLVNAATLQRHDEPFDTSEILARLTSALPDAPIVASELLQDYDDYYYSRSGESPLPVLRVQLGDPLATWLYVDPRTSQVVANVHHYSRIERWLYNGLHSLDFRFWYSKRPLWDLVMLVLLLGGLAGSSIGVYYGIRRLIRMP